MALDVVGAPSDCVFVKGVVLGAGEGLSRVEMVEGNHYFANTIEHQLTLD